jgi:hypothetical protein
MGQIGQKSTAQPILGYAKIKEYAGKNNTRNGQNLRVRSVLTLATQQNPSGIYRSRL